MTENAYNETATAVDQLCELAVKVHRMIDSTPAEGKADARIRMELIGELSGLRMALCIMQGWNPRMEADNDGLADSYIREWWQHAYPDDWSDDDE